MIKAIDYISSETGIQNKDLIEKDMILHLLLGKLSKDGHFHEHFVFKGGTCLTKCYYGYYRFSEDLDFSWISQHDFDGKSQKEIRRILSRELYRLMGILKRIADELGLDFREEKPNRRYVEFGGSTKFTTLKVWYKSAVTDNEQFVKIQINFMEKYFYRFRTMEARSLARGLRPTEFRFLFPEYKALLEDNRVIAYDIREILLEKCRAALTRKGIKARDFIDIDLIQRKEKISITDLKEKIVEKTRFMLRYDKYVQNLSNFNMEKFLLGEEEKLLLKPLPKRFSAGQVISFLNQMAEEIRQ
jgi:predicted nucleotidyltransferase component of viral defense system